VATQVQIVIDSPPNAHTPLPVALPPLRSFISHLAKRSRATTGFLLTVVGYIHRLKSRLSPSSRGLPCTCHRILLAAFVVASKFMHDAPLNNRSWSLFSCLFSVREVNLMERQLLYLLVSDDSH
jgi:hypothetical protein